MKKAITAFLLTLVSTAIMAIPAKRGLWQTIRLTDGTEVRAQLMGDEHVHFWMTETGEQYIENGDVYVQTDREQLARRLTEKRSKAMLARSSAPQEVSMGERTSYTGKKKGLVILVEFTDTKFKANNNLARYKRILNEPGYSEGSFRGSVADYFKAQSSGLFELNFDVVGPYTMKNNYKYYGANDATGNDKAPEEMVIEACKAADGVVNFADYDWDGDGAADQVFILYAGKGEADSNDRNTIWPHMWMLEESGRVIYLDGIMINNYACSNEIDPAGNIEGIGCFCHEFSHCMGFPDFYDTSYSGFFGMGSFDLMDQGSYNGNAFLPCGYSIYEKWMAGWTEPTELAGADAVINNLKAVSEGGEGYIIYNDAHPDEYYIIENRQKTGWDSGIPASGVMITHVDFDKLIWEYNIPNTKVTEADARASNIPVTNDHQRFTIFHADNSESSYTQTSDLYPYQGNNSLTASTKPAATLYNMNSYGEKTMKCSITDITQNSDGTASFKYTSGIAQGQGLPDGLVFYESFNKCNGKGGNDGLWSTTIGAGNFQADNNGWDYQKAFGAYQCARFGTGSEQGWAITPTFEINEEATLTFKAATWNKDSERLGLSIAFGNATIEPSTVSMKSFEWSSYKATIRGTGKIRVKFQPAKRFLIDEIAITEIITTGITDTRQEAIDGRCYDLQGRQIVNSESSHRKLPKGLYIVNGKKVIVK